MLDMIFGFDARLGRLNFFLSCIALGVVNFLLAVPIIYHLIETGMTRDNIPHSVWAMGWPMFALAAFYFVSSFMVASMRVRDIGWDPIIVMSGWFAVLVIDGLVASKIPGWSLGREHHGTIVGGLINFALVMALMFWPSGDHAEPMSARWS